jgi:hypothetical protein
MEVYYKLDANGYPYTTVLMVSFDPEMHGNVADWLLGTTTSVSALASSTTPAPVLE